MSDTPSWNHAHGALVLGADEIHVWRASLTLPLATLEFLERTLPPDEEARARRFRLARDRDRFIAARGILRAILGRYVNDEPGALRFQYGPSGKPRLAGTFDEDRLCFNLSHSDELALYAVARARELGIDVECVRPELAGESIARHFFSPYESGVLRELPESERPAAFFRCWTRKEAYVKARGDGFALSLDQFDVTLAPGEPAALLATRHQPRDVERWLLRDLPAIPGYAAALVVEGDGGQLRCWHWPPAITP